MADYPPITKLSQLDSAIPSGNEAASKLDDSVRQTRGFLKSFLDKAFSDDGTLKVGAVTTVSLPDGSVNEQKLAVDAVTTLKVKNGAINADKLALDAVTEEKIKDGAVTEDKIADESVSGAKLKPGTLGSLTLEDGSVTEIKLGIGAVTETKIGVGSVTEDKIGAVSVGVDKLKLATGSNATPTLIVKGDAGVVEVTVGGSVSAKVVGSVLEFQIGGANRETGLLYARFEERKPTGTHAGGSLSNNIRGPWSALSNESRLLSGNAKRITFRTAGTYLLRLACPAHGLNAGHRVRLRRISGVEDNVLFGTSEWCAPAATSWSIISAILDVEEDATIYEVHHFTGAAINDYGLGRACGDGLGEEIYTVFEVIKL